MKFLRAITTSLLLFSVPAMSFPQIPEEMSFYQSIAQDPTNSPEIPSYDDLVRYIERIENEDLEEICDPEDLERLALFLAQLAISGLLEEDGEEADKLQKDIEELLSDEELSNEIPNIFSYSLTDRAMIPVSFYRDDYQATKCKSWTKKNIDLIKKTSKAIIKKTRKLKSSSKSIKLRFWSLLLLLSQ